MKTSSLSFPISPRTYAEGNWPPGKPTSPDRCMPDVALQVLDALKLYLNIERLIFVVGVDKKVIENLVVEHYRKLGLVTPEEKNETEHKEQVQKAKQYLAKMFQLEVEIAPSEQQITRFLDEQLKEISYWNEPHLSENERELFRGIIYKLAQRNPREVKRLINSALMMGAGAVMIKSEKGGRGIRFNQALQVFFVRKILEDRYTMGSLIGSQRGNEFFGQWSQIVCEGRKKDKYFPNRIRVLEGFGKGLEVDVESKAFQEVDGKQVPMHVEPGRRIMDISFVPEEYGEAYRPLLQNRRFLGLFHLLGDEDLGELMQVQYPPEAAEIAAVVGTSKDADIIREAIARQVGKKPDELNDKDYSKIRQLILEGSDISDLEPIHGLGSLQRLDLRGTQVSNLQSLKDLINLRALDLRETQATTLEPIGDLNNLQRLYLTDTQVNDLSPLKALANLQRLYIGRTQVRTLEPLKALPNLQRLSLVGTQVSSIEPLKALPNLQRLYLRGTQVSSIEPLRALTNLRVLDLQDTQVSSIEPLKALPNLQELDLRSTHVTDEAVQALQKSLPNLRITR